MATKYRITNLINCDESNRLHLADDNKNVTSSSIELRNQLPNQRNIYGAALALIAIMYDITQGIIAVASLLATMALYGNGTDPQ